MKKVVILLVLLLVLVPVALWVGWRNFFASGPSGPVTLNYWGVEQDANSLQPLIDEYQKAHPNVKITYRQLNLNRYLETVQTRILENKGPDIFRFHNTWVPMLKDQLAPMPGSIMDDKLFRSRFYPIANQDLKVNGKVIGLPLDFDSLALVYNANALSSAGFSSPPTDWFQFRQMARKLTIRDERGQVLVGGAALGTSTNVDYFSDILGLMFLQNGTKMITQREVSFHNTLSSDSLKSNLGADALSFYTSFVKDDKVWDRTLPSSVQAFAQGKAAMIIIPSHKLPEVLDLTRKANPPVAFKVAPVPQLPNREPVTWGSFWVEGVSNKSKYQKEAWEFLNFLIQKDSLNRRFNLVTQRSNLGLPYSRVDMRDDLNSNPYLSPYVEKASEAQSWYMASGTFDAGLNDQIVALFGTAVTSVLGSGSAQNALETAAKGAAEVLSEYGLANPPPAE